MKTVTGRILMALLPLFAIACKVQQPDWSGVVTFSVTGPQNIVADGYDTLQLTAHINPNSDPNNRMITFTTDYGTFTNGLATIEVNADINGNASTAIKGTVAATATVTATVQTMFSVKKTINFVTPAATAIFTVNPITGSVPADGVTMVAIGVAVNAKLLITPQSVAFTTTGGTFTNGTATVTQATDPNGNATVYLKSSIAGTFQVSITNNNVTQVVAVTFVAGSPATIFKVNPIQGSVTADGVSTISIGAVVNKALLVTPQNVVFTSTGGTFTTGTNTITLAADANGNAIAYLKSSIAGTFQVSISNSNLTQVVSVTFVAGSPATIFTVNPITSSAPADGVSTIPIGAVVNKALLVEPQNVVFTSDGGTFGNGTTTITQAANQNGNAIAYLKSSVAGTFQVSLTNSNLTQVVPVTFVLALPDEILLSAPTTLDPTSTTPFTITISLVKTVGSPSPNLLFSYSVTDSSGNPITGASFSNGTASNTSGSASVVFYMGSSPYTGMINITVSLQQRPAIKSTISVLVN